MCCHGRPVQTRSSRCDATQRHVSSSSLAADSQSDCFWRCWGCWCFWCYCWCCWCVYWCCTIIGSYWHSDYHVPMINGIPAATNRGHFWLVYTHSGLRHIHKFRRDIIGSIIHLTQQHKKSAPMELDAAIEPIQSTLSEYRQWIFSHQSSREFA